MAKIHRNPNFITVYLNQEGRNGKLIQERLDRGANFRLTIPKLIVQMPSLTAEKLAKAKSLGFSDRQIAHLTGQTEDAVRAERKRIGLIPSYRLVAGPTASARALNLITAASTPPSR
jgi:hypothetical protein